MLYCNGCRGRSIGDIILMDRVPLLSMVRMRMLVDDDDDDGDDDDDDDSDDDDGNEYAKN